MGYRRLRLVAVPALALVLALGAVLLNRSDTPSERVIGLPGVGRDEPSVAVATPSSAPAIIVTTAVSSPPAAPSNQMVETSRPASSSTRKQVEGRSPSNAVPADVAPAPNDPDAAGGAPPEPTTVDVGPTTTLETEGDMVTSTPPPQSTVAVTTTTTTNPDIASFEHTYSAEHEGPVWIEVTAPDSSARTIVIRWGPYQRVIAHQSRWTIVYKFHKGPGATVPTTVTITKGTGVRLAFGEGLIAPPWSVDVNDGWTTYSESPP